ncbi:MAG TPA: hypothetical protein VH413_18480 [Verrucomicrobiae bacterium]|jgi:phage-related protein|nr:hypothetical protein [Verrucomicrobiae bacterium]
MSGTEIIEEIRKLSSEERKQVVAYVNEIQKSDALDSDEDITPEFKRVVDEVFTTNAELFRKLAQ